jgi:hypothetical protein
VTITSLPASTSLLAEVDKLAPGRRKTQDGTVGDLAHQQRVSDHNPDETGNTGSSSDTDSVNEVHARDVDSRGPWPADWSMERIVQTVLARCRTGAEKRLKYVIFNGRIWEASNGWRQRTYTGADQHREHAHFSFRYGSGSGQSNPENITTPWGILAATEQENNVADLTDAEIQKIATAVWNFQLTNPYSNVNQQAGTLLRYAPSQSGVANGVDAKLAPRFAALAAAIAVDDSDEQAVIAGVLAGLDPDALAASIAAQVIAGLPGDNDDVTVPELQEAIVGALRELATPPAVPQP